MSARRYAKIGDRLIVRSPRRGYAWSTMRDRALSLMRPAPRPPALGVIVAVAIVAAETLVVYPLREIAPGLSLGVVYLVGVLVVASLWGLPLGVATAVLSTAAFDFFHVPPALDFVPKDPHGPAALAILLGVALLLSSIAAVARSRAIELDERRSEADLASREREAMGSALRASRDELRLLAEEQAALRRVATVVARGAPPEEVFATVTEEIGRVLPVDFVDTGRYELDRTITFVGSWGGTVARFPVGSRWPLDGNNLSTIVFETGRSARIQSYADATGPVGVAAQETGVSSAVASPIIVDGRLWGVVIAGSTREPTMPADTESRLASFTELLATAIANAENRADLARLAEEQTALRTVATLVAQGAAPEDVFAAVTEEVGRLLPVDIAAMGRYESDGTVRVVASWGRAVEHFPVGSRPSLGGENLVTTVFETGRPARLDSYSDASGPFGVGARATGFSSAVGTPILVEGRLWGVVIAGSSVEEPLPAGTESRLANFTELVATAVANAESRAALAASRARIVAATDETRRRIERDLHDGIQQRLVSLMLELRAAQAAVPSRHDQLETELLRVGDGLASVFDELREISHGIHPAILSKGGLGPALRALARSSTGPVELDLHALPRLPRHVEVAAYYVVSEALTNVAKHAQASMVQVELEADDATLRLTVRDDGIGGADPAQGSGLVGLSDRIEALGGRLGVTSPAGDGTTLLIQIPIEGQSTPRVAERRASDDAL